jgi:hypothetical protein
MEHGEVIRVDPVSGGWSVHCSATGNALMFSSGARAEQAARLLGACLARMGHDVRVSVHDRREILVGTAHYYATSRQEVA